MLLSGTACLTLEDTYIAFSGDILRLANYYVGDWQKAEDMASTTWELAVRFWHRFDGRNPKGWLGRILLNVVRGDWAARKPASSLDLLLDERATTPRLLQYEPDIGGQVAGSECAEAILDAYESLPERDRQALDCRMRQRSYREAAAFLGISVNAYKLRLFRARGRLQDVLTRGESNGYATHD